MNRTNKKKCSICGKEFEGFGNNAFPVKLNEIECCDECNIKYVIPIRIFLTQFKDIEFYYSMIEKLNEFDIEKLDKCIDIINGLKPQT